METQWLYFAGIVYISFGIQALSGFGSTIIAVTLGLHWFSLSALLPVLVMLDIESTGYIVWRYRRHISTRHLFREMVPYMLIGVFAGITFFYRLPMDLLQKGLGVFVIALAVAKLVFAVSELAPDSTPGRNLQKFAERFFRSGTRSVGSVLFSKFLLLSAGAVQGAFASGGPLLVLVADQWKLDKTAFRSTLCAVWALLDGIMLSSYVATGLYYAKTLYLAALLTPVIAVALFTGERLHHAIHPLGFRIFVYLLLLFAGITNFV